RGPAVEACAREPAHARCPAQVPGRLRRDRAAVHRGLSGAERPVSRLGLFGGGRALSAAAAPRRHRLLQGVRHGVGPAVRRCRQPRRVVERYARGLLMTSETRIDPMTREEYLAVGERGRALLADPLTNKGTAFPL